MVELHAASIGFHLCAGVLGYDCLEGLDEDRPERPDARVPLAELSLHKRPNDEGGPVGWHAAKAPSISSIPVSMLPPNPECTTTGLDLNLITSAHAEHPNSLARSLVAYSSKRYWRVRATADGARKDFP